MTRTLSGLDARSRRCWLAACGGLGAESPTRFTPARVVSQETENGATPMFLATPGGGRVVAWVSAPGGGSDGSLHVSVTPAGRAGGASDGHGARSAGRHRSPRRGAAAARRRCRRRDLGAVRGGEGGARRAVPQERAAVHPLGRLGSDLERAAHRERRHRIRLAQLPRAHRGAGRLAAGHLARRAQGEVRRLDEPVHRRRAAPGSPTGRSTPTRPVPAAAPRSRSPADGTIYVAWRAILAGDVRDVVVTRSSDGGKTLGAAGSRPVGRLGLSRMPSRGALARGGRQGRVHVAWWTGKEGEAGVYYARSTDGAKSFAAQPIATGERARPAHVQLAVAGERVYLAWDDGLGEMPRVLLRRSTDGGERFQAGRAAERARSRGRASRCWRCTAIRWRSPGARPRPPSIGPSSPRWST